MKAALYKEKTGHEKDLLSLDSEIAAAIAAQEEAQRFRPSLLLRRKTNPGKNSWKKRGKRRLPDNIEEDLRAYLPEKHQARQQHRPPKTKNSHNDEPPFMPHRTHALILHVATAWWYTHAWQSQSWCWSRACQWRSITSDRRDFGQCHAEQHQDAHSKPGRSKARQGRAAQCGALPSP